MCVPHCSGSDVWTIVSSCCSVLSSEIQVSLDQSAVSQYDQHSPHMDAWTNTLLFHIFTFMISSGLSGRRALGKEVVSLANGSGWYQDMHDNWSLMYSKCIAVCFGSLHSTAMPVVHNRLNEWYIQGTIQLYRIVQRDSCRILTLKYLDRN